MIRPHREWYPPFKNGWTRRRKTIKMPKRKKNDSRKKNRSCAEYNILFLSIYMNIAFMATRTFAWESQWPERWRWSRHLSNYDVPIGVSPPCVVVVTLNFSSSYLLDDGGAVGWWSMTLVPPQYVVRHGQSNVIVLTVQQPCLYFQFDQCPLE